MDQNSKHMGACVCVALFQQGFYRQHLHKFAFRWKFVRPAPPHATIAVSGASQLVTTKTSKKCDNSENTHVDIGEWMGCAAKCREVPPTCHFQARFCCCIFPQLLLMPPVLLMLTPLLSLPLLLTSHAGCCCHTVGSNGSARAFSHFPLNV